jgi:hypothetical protein
MKSGSVAHACNPTCSGGRDQEDCNWRQIQPKTPRDPMSTNENLVHWCIPVILAKIGGSQPRLGMK